MKKVLISLILGSMFTIASAWAADSTMGTTLDDSTLTAKVKTALIADPQTKARQINVETNNGTVQLNGFVDSSSEKAAAARVAQGVDGVKAVQNNLEVRTESRTAGTMVDDSALNARVYAALHQDPNLKARQITVKSSQGSVALGGFVGSQSEKNTAEAVAKSVSGVVSVTNDISVSRQSDSK